MAKDPRAKRESHTYTYPDPLNTPLELPGGGQQERDNLIDPEVTEDTDNIPWIRVRIPRSKADIDKIADFTSSVLVGDGDDSAFKQRLALGNRQTFELLVEDWSFNDQFGMRPNGTEFAKLDKWAGDWVTACVGDAIRQGTSRDYAKKTPSSLISPEASPSESSTDQPTAVE